MPFIKTETYVGETRRSGNYELTPVSQVLRIQIPGQNAGLVWNRPKSVVVKSDDGQEKVLPVVDVTRVTIWAMLAGGLLGAFAMGLVSRRKSYMNDKKE
jgi:hypothetical protein